MYIIIEMYVYVCLYCAWYCIAAPCSLLSSRVIGRPPPEDTILEMADYPETEPQRVQVKVLSNWIVTSLSE